MTDQYDTTLEQDWFPYWQTGTKKFQYGTILEHNWFPDDNETLITDWNLNCSNMVFYWNKSGFNMTLIHEWHNGSKIVPIWYSDSILERVWFHLSEMRKEFMKDDKFKSQYLSPPTEFELTDYDSSTKNAPTPIHLPLAKKVQALRRCLTTYHIIKSLYQVHLSS